MDFCFQGLAWFNKGRTPHNVAQARSFYDRALAADPDNVDALIGSARAELNEGIFSFVAEPLAALAAAEAKLTKALASVPDHALGHMLLGFVEIFTKRAAEGIAECEHALALDRNLADAHHCVGWGKLFIGRAEDSEAHVAEALRLSPRDTNAYLWMRSRGRREAPPRPLRASGRVHSTVERGQSKLSGCIFLVGRRPRAAWADSMKRVRRSRPVSRSIRPTPCPAAPPSRHGAPLVEGLRKAGLPEE